MTFTVSSLHTVQVPPAEPLARVTEDGQLIIYPEGMGKGPMLWMSVSDWRRIVSAAEAALSVYRHGLSGYAANEGNGDAL